MRTTIAAQLVHMSVQHHAPVAWPRQTVNELERLGSAYTPCRWGPILWCLRVPNCTDRGTFVALPLRNLAPGLGERFSPRGRKTIVWTWYHVGLERLRIKKSTWQIALSPARGTRVGPVLFCVPPPPGLPTSWIPVRTHDGRQARAKSSSRDGTSAP